MPERGDERKRRMAGRETQLPEMFSRVPSSALHLAFANVLPLLLGITAIAVKHAQTLHQRSPISCMREKKKSDLFTAKTGM